MKNKYTLKEIANVYCNELGINTTLVEDYLNAVFTDSDYLSLQQKIKELYIEGKQPLSFDSEYFPEFSSNPQDRIALRDEQK